MTPEEKTEYERRRRQRNLVVAAALFGFVILFYAITIVRMGD